MPSLHEILILALLVFFSYTAQVMTGFALRELYRLTVNRKAPMEYSRSEWLNSLWILVAGLIHGIYASGGPPLVHAMSRTLMSRQTFRATLTTVWLITNRALLA